MNTAVAAAVAKTAGSASSTTLNAADDVLQWSDLLLLGHGQMDETHREFVEVVSALQTAADDELHERLRSVTAHLERHFRDEDQWMRDTGYPAAECHVAEHAAVLASGRDVTAALARGDTALCRRYAQELASWFPGHADYLDAPLSQWLSRKRFGAAPIVIKRRASMA